MHKKHAGFWLAVAAALLAACADGPGPGAIRAPTPTARADQYTVVARNHYQTGDDPAGRLGYFVTILLDGRERESTVPVACYEAAVVGDPLPVTVRSSAGDVVICR
ncbi:MAG: hypothetical protein WEC33_05195 [Dehalococcoidia bacterium]